VTPEVVVRPGRREEIPDVLGLWREAGSVPSVSDDPASLERLLETSKDALLVAETDGLVVGTIIAGWDGWRANFYRLAVLPSARRQGIALRLVVDAERPPRRQGRPPPQRHRDVHTRPGRRPLARRRLHPRHQGGSLRPHPGLRSRAVLTPSAGR